MTKPIYKVGMLIDHPKRPQWGPGRVVALEEGKIFVYFRNELSQKATTLLTAHVSPTIAEDQSDPVLDLLPTVTHDGFNYMLPKNYQKVMHLQTKVVQAK